MNPKTDAVTVTMVGVALGQVTVYVLELRVLADPMPAEIAMAIGTLITGALLFAKNLYTDWRSRHAETDTDGD